MTLNIGGSTVGYDTSGFKQLINDVKTQCITPTITSIRNNTLNVRNTINNVWVGASADAFKEKLINDSDALCAALEEAGELISTQINSAGSNIEDVDAEIAAQLFGASASGGDTFIPSGTTVKEVDNNKNKSVGEKIEDFFESMFSYKTTIVENGVEKEVQVSVNPYGNMEGTGDAGGIMLLGVAEGVGKFGEKILDGITVLGLATNEYQMTSEQIQQTRDYIAEDTVKTGMDKAYAACGLDDFLYFDQVRKVSNITGEVACTVAIGAATGGAGVVADVGGVTLTGSTCVSAGVSAATGFGAGAAEALKNQDVSVGESVAYGAITGAVSGVKTLALGAVNDNVNVFVNSSGFVSAGTSSTVKTAVENGGKELTTVTNILKNKVSAEIGMADSWVQAAVKTGYADSSKYGYENADSYLQRVVKTYTVDNGSIAQGMVTSGLSGYTSGIATRVANESIGLVKTGGLGNTSKMDTNVFTKILSGTIKKELLNLETDTIQAIADSL